jgi:alpha-L-fucosidase
MCLCETWSYSDTPVKSPKQLVDMLVTSLCGDGNMLLSWGPQWSGAFAPHQIAALEALGGWLKKNKEAVYGTRGGPWTPANWGGSVHRGKLVYLHIKSLPQGNILKLEGLKSRVLTAKIHGGAKTPFQQTGESLEITVPAAAVDPLCTVVELTLDTPFLKIIHSEVSKSIFEAPEYGSVISDQATLKLSSISKWDNQARHPELFKGTLTKDQFAFHTDFEKHPYAIIDLGRESSIRGILIRNREGYPMRNTYLVVSLSDNGQRWEKIWTVSDTADNWEIPVTSFVAGAHVPGKSARYIKIERQLNIPDALHLQTVKVYGQPNP